ncbi:hypothetical protein ACXJJ3_03090 [Kribbella sp. WER1]
MTVTEPWSAGDLTVLQRCATAGLPTVVIALKLGRCVDAVRGKAAEAGVALVGEHDRRSP